MIWPEGREPRCAYCGARAVSGSAGVDTCEKHEGRRLGREGDEMGNGRMSADEVRFAKAMLTAGKQARQITALTAENARLKAEVEELSWEQFEKATGLELHQNALGPTIVLSQQPMYGGPNSQTSSISRRAIRSSSRNSAIRRW